MAEIDVLKAQLVRREVNAPWGFRLQGGAEFDRPITIMSVRPGSPAHKIGLRAGDEVTEIGDTPTSNLSSRDANDLILTYGLSLILTVERRARGAIPTNPVVSHQQQPQLKSYQPYDLSGAMPTHHRQMPQPQNYEIQTVSARPYDPPPGQRHNPLPPSHYQPEPSGYSRNAYGGGYDEEDQSGDRQHQSRTFKILQSLMANEGGAAVSAEADPSKAAPTRVIRNAQFNSPIGLYNNRVAADALSDKMTTVGIQDSHHDDGNEEDGKRVVIKSNVLDLVQEMDKDEKETPSRGSRRGPRMRDLPRSRSRVQESFERDELNSERIGNVSHIRSMRAQKQVDENSNLPKGSSVTHTSNLPSERSQNYVHSVSPEQSSHSYVQPMPPEQSQNYIDAAPAEATAIHPTKFEATPIAKDSEDLSASNDLPSFLQKKTTTKQWRPVRPAFDANKNNKTPNYGVNQSANEGSSFHSSYGNNENNSNISNDQRGYSSQMKFTMSASPRLSDPYPSNPPPQLPANQNARNESPQPRLVGDHSSVAGVADEGDYGRPGPPATPVRPDLLRAEDDIPSGIPHQSRTFRMLQDMVGDEEPYSGSQGLPPPRSVAMDRQRQAQANPNRDRVKVFMPQQYNTPITMYSAANIMDTFQGQAGAHIENMDDQRAASLSPISGAQQAVMEQDHVDQGGFSDL